MVSPLKMEMCRDSFNTEADPQLIMLSESFQHSLLVMERSIVANIFQPKLAAYRQLPVLEGKLRFSLLSHIVGAGAPTCGLKLGTFVHSASTSTLDQL